MKIEMGESLAASWLKHHKKCQLVQTNWKPSPCWQTFANHDIDSLFSDIASHFKHTSGYDIFKSNSGSAQLLRQAEIDVVGYDFIQSHFYGVEIAFHAGGLQYNGDPISHVIKKLARAAMCFWTFFEGASFDLIFATPKAPKATEKGILHGLSDLNSIFGQFGLMCSMDFIANDRFKDEILNTTLAASCGVEDSGELFLRGYRLLQVCKDEVRPPSDAPTVAPQAKTHGTSPHPEKANDDPYQGLKVGEIANQIFRSTLESGIVPDAEILSMEDRDYSKKHFGLQYPVLIQFLAPEMRRRYYTTPCRIKGRTYHICSQWFETPTNNDRPLLLQWLAKYGA